MRDASELDRGARRSWPSAMVLAAPDGGLAEGIARSRPSQKSSSVRASVIARPFVLRGE
jgi:hypothetical protein